MEQKTTMIGVVVKPTQRQLLETAAGDQPVSTWMREVALGAARVLLEPLVRESEGGT